MEEKTQKEKIVEFFQSLNWPGMIFEDNKISCPSGDVVIFNKKDVLIDFHYYNRQQNSYEKTNNRQSLIISDKINIDNVLRTRYGSDYNIPWFQYIKLILSIDDTFSKIKILNTGKKILRKTNAKTIQIPEPILIDILGDSYDVFKKGKSSRDRIFSVADLVRTPEYRSLKYVESSNLVLKFLPHAKFIDIYLIQYLQHLDDQILLTDIFVLTVPVSRSRT